MTHHPRVYVLGAGFSHGYDAYSLPLMRDFLQSAKVSRNYRIDKEHAQLARFIAMYFGIAEYHDIEKIMSFLAMPALDDPVIPSENRQKLYDDLVNVIHSTLGQLHINPLSGSHGFYAAFADYLSELDCTVISFNYDLLLDRLLYQTGRWLGADGYGAEIPPLDNAFPIPHRPRFASSRGPVRSTATLLKPHGSINWGIPTLHQDFDETIYQEPSGYYARDVPGISGDGPHSIRGISFASHHPPLTIRCRPYIVPPLLDKSLLLKHRTLRVIWNIARESVEKAEEILFIGYSLPLTDYAVEFLFRQARKGNSPKVTVVAPDATTNLRSRYVDVFGKDVSTLDMDFHGWLIANNVIEPNKLSRFLRSEP